MNLSLSLPGLRGKMATGLTAFAVPPTLLNGADGGVIAAARKPAPALSPTQHGREKI